MQHSRILHAFLQVEALRGCVSMASTRLKLKHLPIKLEDMYIETLQRIHKQLEERAELAIQILTYVAYVKQVFSVSELQHALAISVESQDLDVGRIVPEETIVSVCCGLITVTEDIHGLFGPSKRTVRFIRKSNLLLFQLVEAHCFYQTTLHKNIFHNSSFITILTLIP